MNEEIIRVVSYIFGAGGVGAIVLKTFLDRKKNKQITAKGDAELENMVFENSVNVSSKLKQQAMLAFSEVQVKMDEADKIIARLREENRLALGYAFYLAKELETNGFTKYISWEDYQKERKNEKTV